MEGIDLPRVTEWLLANVESVEAPFGLDFISGGRSNLTFEVTDARARRLVLRRPPISHVLSTAHDMGREHRIISALRATPVPVPAALGYCDDEAVNGRPFYVMEYVDGHVLRTAKEAEEVLDEGARRTAGNDLVDVLVAIHGVDVDAVGLGDLGRRGGYIERQLKRWYGQFQQSQAQEAEAGIHRAVPLVDEVHDLLCKHVPDQQGVAIAHGDYRLDNTIVGPDGRIRAVLDWELCTLGDPLADLGILLIYWADRVAGQQPRVQPTTALPGFPTKAELVERYGARSGRDLAALPFYVAFGHWKLACISEGVFARYATGAMGSGQSLFDPDGQQVTRRAQLALDALAEL